MNEPAAPVDPELKNIIDRLAQFVARNGPEFEKMTMEKQHGNPKFNFLNPNEEYNDYYRFVVSREFQSFSVGFNQPPPPPDISQAEIYLDESEIPRCEYSIKDIEQSEENLKAQKKIFDQQEVKEISESLIRLTEDYIENRSIETDCKLADMNNAIHPLMQNCTKDNIARGKSWIFDTMSKNERTTELMGDFLVFRSSQQNIQPTEKLHLVYLINDLLHTMKKRGATHHLQNVVNRIVVPLYCLAAQVSDDDTKSKLQRVLDIWRKNEYLPTDVMDKMAQDSIESSLSSFMDSQLEKFKQKIDEIRHTWTEKFNKLKKQHDEFADYVNKQLAITEAKRRALEQQKKLELRMQQKFDNRGPAQFTPEVPPPNFSGPPMTGPPPPWLTGPPPGFDSMYFGPSMLNNPPPEQMNFFQTGFYADFPGQFPQNERHPFDYGCEDYRMAGEGYMPTYHQEDESYEALEISDQKQLINLMPECPHWQLPAGIMISLIRMKDFDFIPLKEKDLRLNPALVPSLDLMEALDSFYSPPSHDRPRDADGWERLALYEFNCAKQKIREQLESKKPASSQSSSLIDSEEEDPEAEENRTFKPTPRKRTSSTNRPPPLHLAHITAYPTSAVGQPLKTGPKALESQAAPTSFIVPTLFPTRGSVPNISVPPPIGFQSPPNEVIPRQPPPKLMSLSVVPPVTKRTPTTLSATRGGFSRERMRGASSSSSSSSDSRSRSRSHSRSKSPSPRAENRKKRTRRHSSSRSNSPDNNYGAKDRDRGERKAQRSRRSERFNDRNYQPRDRAPRWSEINHEDYSLSNEQDEYWNEPQDYNHGGPPPWTAPRMWNRPPPPNVHYPPYSAGSPMQHAFPPRPSYMTPRGPYPGGPRNMPPPHFNNSAPPSGQIDWSMPPPFYGGGSSGPSIYYSNERGAPPFSHHDHSQGTPVHGHSGGLLPPYQQNRQADR